MCISRLAEEIFPFFYYFYRVRQQRRRCGSPNILNLPMFASYTSLSQAQLSVRLKEEHTRASALDDKTFKLTLSLSVGLTVLGSAAASLLGALTSPALQVTLALVIGAALFYFLLAGFVALGGVRTSATYGYGTKFLLQKQTGVPNVIADALARQEIMNIIRHLRNETAYQALRNGLILLFAGLLLFATLLARQTFWPSAASVLCPN